MSLLVPWNDPGEPPCCCDDSCPNDDSGPDASLSPGTYVPIADADYDALLAGGNFTLDVNINIACTSSDGAQFTPPIQETATASYADVAMETRESVLEDQPCYNQLVPSDQLFTTHQLSGPFNPLPPTEQRPLEVNFTYALAIIEGVRSISLANAKASSGQGFNLYVAQIGSQLGLDLPDATRVVVANPLVFDPAGPQYTQANGVIATVQLVVGPTTYSDNSIARVFYDYVVPGITAQSFSGSIVITARYAPFAP